MTFLLVRLKKLVFIIVLCSALGQASDNKCLPFYKPIKNPESFIEYQIVPDDLTSDSITIKKKIGDLAKEITARAKQKKPEINSEETEKKVSETLVQFINSIEIEFERMDKIYGTSLIQNLIFYFDQSSLSLYFNIFNITHSVDFSTFRKEARVTPDGYYYTHHVPDSFNLPRIIDLNFIFNLKVKTIHSILRQRHLWRPENTSPQDGKVYRFNDIPGYELYVKNPKDTITLYRGSYTVQNEYDVSKRIHEGHRSWVSFSSFGKQLFDLSPDQYLKKMIDAFIARKGTSINITGLKTFFAGFTRDLETALEFVRNSENYYEFEIPKEVLIDSNNLISYTINTENEMLTLFGTHPSWLKRVVRDGVEIYKRDK